MIRDIIQAPDERLLRPCFPVLLWENGEFPTEARRVIGDLTETRAIGRGPGLAAPQIGEPLRIVAVDPNVFFGFTVLVNPEITDRGKQMLTETEGCMSIGRGHARFPVKRHRVVTVKFLDHNAVERIVVAKGFPARMVQHEVDHLDGKLIA